MSNIYDIAAEFRAALLRRERKSSLELLRRYGVVWTRLQNQIERLTRDIEKAQANGETVSENWLYRQDRYKALINQLSREIHKFAGEADKTITGEQKEAIRQAVRHASTLMDAAVGNDPAITGNFNRLPVSAVESLAGFAGNGSPLRDLLNKLGPDTARRVTDSLVDGIARGHGSKKIASGIKEALGGNAARALTIARTETLRAYREASRETYKANADVVEGWQWRSSRNVGTCPVCWAMDGTMHSLDDPFGTHPNCRCVQIPVTEFTPQKQRDDKGIKAFDGLPDEDKARILGPVKFQAYQSGAITLPDLIGFHDHPQWGPTRRERGLKEATSMPNFGALGRAPKPIKERVLPPAPAPPKAKRFSRAYPTAAEIRAQLPGIENKYDQEYRAALREIGDSVRAGFNTTDPAESALLKKREDSARRRAKKAISDKAKAMRALLFVDKADAATVGVDYQGDAAKMKSIKQGADDFNRLVGRGLVDGLRVRASKAKGRAFHQTGRGIFITRTNKAYVVVHELGHWLEDQRPDIHAKIVAFYARRTSNDKLERLKDLEPGAGYDAQEVTKKDKFINPYVGKWYVDATGNQRASEILSMGLEYLHRDPAWLAQKDPDFFDFIYGLIRDENS